jgi:hypothetical protein
MAKKDPASKRLGADTRSQHAVNMARSTTRKRKRPRTSSYRLPELVRPDGASYMALYCAAQWIATRGGTLEINPLDEELWREAFKDLLDRIASEDVKVFGVRDGTKPEHISGIHFASCLVDYPFSFSERSLIREELCLVSRPYIDDEHWRRAFNDSLEDRRGVRWRRLMVLKADVARCWPFATAQDHRTGAPGRPSVMYLVEEEHHARWQRGEAETGINAEARALAEWYHATHLGAPQLTAKTIANRIRHDHRKYVAERPKEARN